MSLACVVRIRNARNIGQMPKAPCACKWDHPSPLSAAVRSRTLSLRFGFVFVLVCVCVVFAFQARRSWRRTSERPIIFIVSSVHVLVRLVRFGRLGLRSVTERFPSPPRVPTHYFTPRSRLMNRAREERYGGTRNLFGFSAFVPSKLGKVSSLKRAAIRQMALFYLFSFFLGSRWFHTGGI